MCWQVAQSYPCQPGTPARARLFCAETLPSLLAATAARDPLIELALLVVSELVTNAVNAGCVTARLILSMHHDRLRVGVCDDAAGQPQMAHPSRSEPHGRGLLIIASVARSWGVTPAATGKEVWAELDVDTELTTALDCRL
jgi:hypothetical protein